MLALLGHTETLLAAAALLVVFQVDKIQTTFETHWPAAREDIHKTF